MDFEQLKTYLDDFKSKVDANLEDIHQCKEDIARLRSEIYSYIDQGQYIRDEKRIVLSAPEIIIGDVDSFGNLLGPASKVIIRTKEARIDGVGQMGQVNINAPSIIQKAIDTGIDGKESVVQPTSAIISQARSISMEACICDNEMACMGTFPQHVFPADGTITMRGDKEISVNASAPGLNEKDRLTTRVNAIDAKINKLNQDLPQKNNDATAAVNTISKTISQQELLQINDLSLRTNTSNLEGLNEAYRLLLPSVQNAIEDYYNTLAELSELKRQKKSLDADKKNLMPANENDYLTKSTKSSVTINSEKIALTSRDADGNLRTNKEAGIFVQGNTIDLSGYAYYNAQSNTMELLPYSSVSIAAMNIDLHTSDYSGAKTDANTGKVERIENPVGEITIDSRHITVESTKKKVTKTYKVEGNKTILEVKSEVQGYPEARKNNQQQGGEQQKKEDKGIVLVKANAVNVEAVDKDNKVDGTISLNAKRTELTALNAKGTDNEEKEFTADSVIKLYAEKISTGLHGNPEDKKFSKKVQTAAENFIAATKENIVLASNDAKSLVQVTKDKIEVSSKNVTLYGETEVKGETSFGSNIKVKGAVHANGVEAKDGLKSKNTSEGIVMDQPDNKDSAKEAAKADGVDKDKKP